MFIFKPIAVNESVNGLECILCCGCSCEIDSTDFGGDAPFCSKLRKSFFKGRFN